MLLREPESPTMHTQALMSPRGLAGAREETEILRPRGWLQREEREAWLTCAAEDGAVGTGTRGSYDLKELEALPDWRCHR